MAMMHLGWFVGRGFSVHGWSNPWYGTGATDWTDPDIYVDLVRALDRACFDYVMIEDGSFVPDAYRGSSEWHLRNAAAVPKADPMPLVPLLGQATRHLGIVATMTTSFYPPYLAARLAATLDHLTRGRFGLNLVTAHNDRSAQNFGLDRHFEHDLRYVMADEWIEVVDRLWRSWEPDAVVADAKARVFADFTKVRPIDFDGRYYRSRGPLNMPPGPQGRPVICQAGGSPAGRAFAAKHADTIVARVRNIASARAFRADISARMTALGRDPSRCKVLFCTSIMLDDTMEGARQRRIRQAATLSADLEPRLAALSFFRNVDFSKFDLDAPLPPIETNASRTMTEAYTPGAGARTLREIVTDPGSGGLDFTGTPDGVAEEMEAAMQEIGGDGFMVTEPLARRTIAEITDGLAPALQRRRVLRTEYEYPTFRENLLAF